MKELLLIDFGIRPSQIYAILKDVYFNNVLSVLSISTIFALFSDSDILGPLVRTFKGFVLISFYLTFLNFCVQDVGFPLADRIIGGSNKISQAWSSSHSFSTEYGGLKSQMKRQAIEQYTVNEANWWEFKKIGPWAVAFIANISLFFVSLSFSIAFYVSYMVLPIICLISITPFSKNSLDGALIAPFFLALAPILIAIFIELLDFLVIRPKLVSSNSTVVQLLVTIFFIIYIIFSISMAMGIVKNGSVGETVAKVSEGFGYLVMAGAAKYGYDNVLKKPAHKLGSGMSRFAWDKGINPSRQMALGGLDGIKNKINDSANAIKDGVSNKSGVKGSLSNKGMLGLDRAINPGMNIKNNLAQRSLQKHGGIDSPTMSQSKEFQVYNSKFRKEEAQFAFNNGGKHKISKTPKSKVVDAYLDKSATDNGLDYNKFRRPSMAEGFVDTKKDLVSSQNDMFSSSEKRALYNDPERLSKSLDNIRKINSNNDYLRTMPSSERKDSLIHAWSEFNPKDKSTHLINRSSYNELRDEFGKSINKTRR